jgi:hypothetical protein
VKQTRIQKDRKASQNGRVADEQDQGDPDVHEDARQARRRAQRASARADRFLKETE